MATLKLYLSGSIKKGRSDGRCEAAFWTEEHERIIEHCLGQQVSLLNPAKTNIRRNDYFANYGCDLYLVKIADAMLVDLREEKGVGVGAELMFAQSIGKPVIGWSPKNSYYRRDLVEDVFGEDLVNWVHPFAFGLCDHLVESLEGACALIRRMREEGRFEKIDGRSPAEAISYFAAQYPALTSE